LSRWNNENLTGPAAQAYQFGPDKSTVRRLDHCDALLESRGFNWPGLMTFTRMTGLQCLLHQLDEPFVQRTPNFPSGLRTEGSHQ
jgi:hypothetical protein